MSNRRKNNEILAEINQYLNNKMSNKERYEFERLLERDPFLAEALEGMSTYKTSDIEKDLSAIDLLSGKKSRKIKPVVYLSVAAGFLLIVVSAVLFHRPEKNQIVLTQKQETANEMAQPYSFQHTTATTTDTIESDSTNLLLAETKLIEKREATANNNLKGLHNKKQIETKSAKKDVAKENILIKKATTAPQKMMSAQVMKPEIDNNLIELPIVDNNRKIDSDSSNQHFAATNTQDKGNVTVNVAAQSKAMGTEVSKAPVRKSINAKAQPIGGMDLFNAYLDKNRRYPLSEKNPKREIIRLKFDITISGIPTNFKITKTPKNDDFSSEAIRLVKDGPKWSPTIKEGIPVKDEISLRIVFKPTK